MKKAERILRDFRAYNKGRKLDKLQEVSYQDYLKIRSGTKRHRITGVSKSIYATSLIRQAPKYPSGDGSMDYAARKPENKYTGGNLIGIGVMHKSNLVPIFREQDAEDLANMRRN